MCLLEAPIPWGPSSAGSRPPDMIPFPIVVSLIPSAKCVTPRTSPMQVKFTSKTFSQQPQSLRLLHRPAKFDDFFRSLHQPFVKGDKSYLSPLPRATAHCRKFRRFHRHFHYFSAIACNCPYRPGPFTKACSVLPQPPLWAYLSSWSSAGMMMSHCPSPAVGPRRTEDTDSDDEEDSFFENAICKCRSLPAPPIYCSL